MDNETEGNVVSYKMDENNVITVSTTYIPNEKGLGYQLFKSMLKYKHCIAQYIADTDEEDTYGELLQRSIRVAFHLQEYHLEKSDVIMGCSSNHKSSCVPFLASCFAGLQFASLDPTLSLFDIVHLLKEVPPRIIFVVPEALELIEQSISELDTSPDIIVFGESDRFRSFDELLQPFEGEDLFLPAVPNSLEEPAVIFFSSGTTGLPKGIVLSHYSLAAQTNNFIESGNIGPVQLLFTTLYWISGILFLTSSIMLGAARVICRQYNPKEVWNLIDKYKANCMFMGPSQAIDMGRNGRPDDLDTTSLWTFLIGGAPISEIHLRELRELLPGTFIFQVYGQTEAGALLTVFKTNDVKETLLLYYKPNSCGTPVPGITYKIVDIENENTCGLNEQGELRIKSRVVMNGYYNRDSTESFDSDGWLRTGDIGYFDEDYCFYYVDRIKEMLKFRSWHVPPAMIEKLLCDHPAVHQALVIGLPDEEDGDHPMAIVVPSDGYKGNITEEEIENYVAERAPDRMRLRGGVKFLESMPVTPSGKIKRKDIREMVLREEI